MLKAHADNNSREHNCFPFLGEIFVVLTQSKRTCLFFREIFQGGSYDHSKTRNETENL